MRRAKHLRLGAIFPGIGQHRWGWLDPKSDPAIPLDFPYHRRVAQEAEAAKLDFLFFSDGQYIDADTPPSRLSTFEPLTLLSALSTVTSHIGLIGTETTSYADPYTVARQFSSLDSLSKGRAGWNLVTTGEEKTGLNFSRDTPPDPDEQYRRADEHLEVVRGLWDSWEDNAFLYDRANRRFFDPRKLHPLDHKGEYFSVKGPLNIERSPQGQPVIVHAGESEAGLEFGTKLADIMIIHGRSLAALQEVYRRLKTQAASHGRAPENLLVMSRISPIIGASDEEAKRRFQDLADLPDPDDDLPCSTFVGRPEKIADDLELWVNEGAADGFVLDPVSADGLSDFIGQVLPILRSKGLFRDEYGSTTLRGNLGVPLPPNRYTVAQA